MSAEAERFVVDMRKFVRKSKDVMDQVVRKVVLDIGTSVVMRSPVGDPSGWASPAPKGYVGGRFRANWQYAETTRPQGTLGEFDPSGQKSIARMFAKVGLADAAGKIHYLTNNLPYGPALERGWSKQAPAGMVGLAVREFQATVERAARAMRRDS